MRMVTGAYDKQVPPDRVRDLYADLGAERKIFVDLACSSHNAMWEKNHLMLFQASLEWLRDVGGPVGGTPPFGDPGELQPAAAPWSTLDPGVDGLGAPNGDGHDLGAEGNGQFDTGA